MASFKTDLEIAREGKKIPIIRLAEEKLNISDDNLIPYGHYKAKVSFDNLKKDDNQKTGKLILVTAMTPTTAGEGKTTTSVGLTDGLNHIGKKAMVALMSQV